LGTLALRRNDPQQSRRLLTEGLGLFREVQSPAGVALCIAALAALASSEKQWAQAASLLGFAKEASLGVADDRRLSDAAIRAEWEGYDRHLEALRQKLGEITFEAALRAAQGLSLGDAVVLATSGEASGQPRDTKGGDEPT
jgi:hypothetical protein